jgi:SAM-dependent methyltransferase
MAADDSNFKAFSTPEAVAFYASYSGLQPAETYAFDKFVPDGASILDIGVGCGRTTPYLAARAARYVGIDYVQAMVDICAARFPKNAFYRADATRLSLIEDASVDIVVFSFNGIDAITTKEGRLRCLSEVFRVLRPGGLFIFSSHNAKMLINLPSFDNAGPLRKVWRLVRSAFKSVPFAARLVRSGAFRAGAGYYFDPAHGGIRGYCSTPKLIEVDVSSIGFQLLEVISSAYPRRIPRYFIPWYYYVLAKRPVKQVFN